MEHVGGESVSSYDFLISFDREVEAWAHWIAWQIEDTMPVNGQAARCFFEGWDVVPGASTIGAIDEALRQSTRVVLVLSPSAMSPDAGSGGAWQAALSNRTEDGLPAVVPVRVIDGRPRGVLQNLRYVDLVGLSEADAIVALRSGLGHAVSGTRPKSSESPPFPGRPGFPGGPVAEGAASNDSRAPSPMTPGGMDRSDGTVQADVISAADTAGATRRAGPADRPRRRRWLPPAAAVLVVIVVATAITYVLEHRVGSVAVGGTLNVALAPTRTPGPNPFMPAVGDDVSGVKPPTAHGSRVANTPGLFGGTRDNARCDSSTMKTFLHKHPDLLAAWSAVLGIKPAGLDDYVRGLTPVTLRADTAVTNHGFKNGRATTVPAILQAGTAVLVDAHGTPVVKCFCGNPLTPPVRYSTAEYTGPRWSGFTENNVVSVQPVAAPVREFVLVDTQTGKPFQRTVGTSGTQDQDYAGKAGGCGGAGTSPEGGGLQLVVLSGELSCAEAQRVLAAYHATPPQEQQGSGRYATVDGWQCNVHSIAAIEQDGRVDFCQRGNVTFDTERALTVSAVSTGPLTHQWTGARLAEALLPSEFYFPGVYSGGPSGPLSSGNSGSTIGAPAGPSTGGAKIDCQSLTPQGNSAFSASPNSFPGENANAYVAYVSDAVGFATEIMQFATEADASKLLAAVRDGVQRCAGTESRAARPDEISLAAVDGYPAVSYRIYSDATQRVLFVADGVDIVCVTVFLGADNVAEPAKPTLPAAADAIMAGIATLGG
ncbi:toll/interleukin-1 receptor domain-containing protein [Frankia sp. AgB32]|uniref:DUF6777 domain-containing protein n=1 Tax=Frankia sp. AgB32 TaxID=631119 RepID=UPI00200BE1EC|nr:toll/interleukin-1 receptor domain-containing protein [Frankia sp. AgB32]MCK9895826.1 toll/interleukin-1 receptor domain-containing protein [Frankia sp. AgB32]